ncbi:dynamin family protein [Desulfosarcina sp.]|uniref:dynamin family protein n=1 Tax=Desulfosarcina sp. TaxID=2027861 RepID=UPI003562D7A4
MDPLYDEGTIAAVRGLKEDTAALADLVAIDSVAAVDAWKQAVDTRLLPRLTPEFPLVAAICGGGSSGKSTLFNTLVGEAVSPTGGRAGMNRRILVSLNATHRGTPSIADALFEPFGCPPQQMTDMQALTTPGDPLLHYSSGLPADLALLDTPDFDTGAGGSYQNREMAERSLRAADVFVYIFTNANYNNRDNTDFVARMLTAVGTRSCFLVYRAYPGFTDDEVLEHAGTVAKNLYGDRAERHVLGVYRAGEDNQVAAGQRAMTILPVEAGQPDLMAALTRMDPRQVRRELHRSIFNDVIRQGHRFFEEARESSQHLALYLTCLRTVQQRSVQDALGHLPMDAVVRRFSEIWQDTDPSHVKIMRKTGRVVETPVRLLMRAAKWLGGRKPKENGFPDGDKMAAALEADLIRAANRLRQAAVDPAVVLHLSETDPAVGPLRESIRRLAEKTGATVQRTDSAMVSFKVPLHPVLAATQADLRSQNWSAVVDDMLARQEGLLGLTSQLEADLQRLAHEQRSRMTTIDQIRQTFSAMLNILPATAAVTYVLHTGDPVGAVGIKVKLAGLFGLNDLYALVAIPATAGMKKADLKQLEALLGPVARAWLTHKLTAIEALFEEKITGPLLGRGREMAEHTAKRIDSMAERLARCGRALEKKT